MRRRRYGSVTPRYTPGHPVARGPRRRGRESSAGGTEPGVAHRFIRDHRTDWRRRHGEVYRAIDTDLKRPIAIKVLPPSVSGVPDRLARFQREAEWPVVARLPARRIADVLASVVLRCGSGLGRFPVFGAIDRRATADSVDADFPLLLHYLSEQTTAEVTWAVRRA